MAQQTLKGGLFLPSPAYLAISTTPSFTASVIDAADEGVAFVLRIPKTGNVAKVLWTTRTTTTGATLNLRGETLDETVNPAIPSGTLYHANFTASPVIVNTDDNVAVLSTLAAAVAVTRGDKIAIILKQPNTSFGNMQIGSFGDDLPDFPYTLLNTGVSPAISWAAVAGAPVIGLEYDDGTYEVIDGCYPFHALTTTTFNNSSTPDEIGGRFQVPVPCRLTAWWGWLDADGDYNVNVYDSDGATKIAGTPYAVDKDTRRGSAANIVYHRFTSTANLLANTYYRLVIEPSSATNLSLYDFTSNTAAALDAFDGGQLFHLTSAKNPTQESDWTNTLTRRPFLGVKLDGFSDGVSTGGVAKFAGDGGGFAA